MSDSNQAMIHLYLDAARDALAGAQYNLDGRYWTLTKRKQKPDLTTPDGLSNGLFSISTREACCDATNRHIVAP